MIATLLRSSIVRLHNFTSILLYLTKDYRFFKQ